MDSRNESGDVNKASGLFKEAERHSKVNAERADPVKNWDIRTLEPFAHRNGPKAADRRGLNCNGTAKVYLGFNQVFPKETLTVHDTYIFSSRKDVTRQKTPRVGSYALRREPSMFGHCRYGYGGMLWAKPFNCDLVLMCAKGTEKTLPLALPGR
jgi:hypothetical protein